jgi:hypothetical protein
MRHAAIILNALLAVCLLGVALIELAHTPRGGEWLAVALLLAVGGRCTYNLTVLLRRGRRS